jgi:hypothetical protein
MLAQTYLPRRAADIFGRTNNGHTPLAAILLCSVFGFVSLASLSRRAYDQVIHYFVLHYRKVHSQNFTLATLQLFCADTMLSHVKRCRLSSLDLLLVSIFASVLPFSSSKLGKKRPFQSR